MQPRFAALTTLVLSPALLVGAWGLIPGWAAIPIALFAAAPVFLWLRGRERQLPPQHVSRRWLSLWLVLVLAATIQLGRVGVFVVDPDRHSYAALPHAELWALYHVCFTGYTEAARLAAEGQTNIYDPSNYEANGQSRRIGRLIVDEYEYPPPFLPLPAALSALTGEDVLRARALFYGLQAVLLVMAMVAVAMRLPSGARVSAWLLIPGVVAAFQTILGMQYGNFQSGAFALAMVGMLAATGPAAWYAMAALAFAGASKLFPGLLLALLLGARRYRAAAFTVTWMTAFALLSVWLFGMRPYVDFITYQLPAISSGSGFAWAEYPMLVPINYGISGVVLKLGGLGLPGMTFARAMQVASLYGLLIVGLAVVAGWRIWNGKSQDAATAGGPMLWLALLNLASFRSPYVADAQATMGSLWLLSLVIATYSLRGWHLALATLAWICWSLSFEGLAPHQPSVALLAFTLTNQTAVILFNVGVLIVRLRPGRPAAVEVTTPAVPVVSHAAR